MNTMKRAWQLAKIQSKRFGGQAKNYLSRSLKLAWREAKVNELITNRKHITYALNQQLGQKKSMLQANSQAKVMDDKTHTGLKRVSCYLQRLIHMEDKENVRVSNFEGVP